jgi:hypothetical protein
MLGLNGVEFELSLWGGDLGIWLGRAPFGLINC